MLKKTIIVVFCLLVFDFLSGFVLDYILEKQSDGRYFKAKYSLGHTTEDIIIIGSSRAEQNFVPEVFEKELKMSCWNTGRGGQSIPFLLCIQAAILKRYTPKIVIINIDLDGLSNRRSMYERAGFLKPFWNKHSEIRSILSTENKRLPFYMLSNMYRYNSSLYYLLRPFLFPGIDGFPYQKGWKPGRMRKKDTSLFKDSSEIKNSLYGGLINAHLKSDFKKLIEGFTNNGTDVFLVISPDFSMSKKTNDILCSLKEILPKKHINMYDYSEDPNFCGNQELYKDSFHLNEEGAILFSKKVALEIKKSLISSVKIER